jgi:hypothetical protein
MNTAEIVVREVQGDSGFQVRKLFAKAECESRKALARCPTTGPTFPWHAMTRFQGR